MNRELDSCYFRVERDGKWQNICFSDLTEEEMEKVTKGRSEEWLRSLAIYLGQRIRAIGDQLDIVNSKDDGK